MRTKTVGMLVLGLLGCDVEAPADDSSADAVQEGDACKEAEATAPCAGGGLRYCDNLLGDEELQWGVCVTEPRCELGEESQCTVPEENDGGMGTEYCILHEGEPRWDSSVFFDAGCNTPLVLSFDGAPAVVEPAPAATFDLDGVGACISTDWPTEATPWLALDWDRDGSVTAGSELFGSGYRMADGRRAANGFAALAELDSNGDGRISTADARFADLVLWSDIDRDKRGTLAEFESLAARGILSIELDFGVERVCDERGNCGVERATFDFIDRGGEVRTGAVVDIHLACQ